MSGMVVPEPMGRVRSAPALKRRRVTRWRQQTSASDPVALNLVGCGTEVVSPVRCILGFRVAVPAAAAREARRRLDRYGMLMR